MRPQLGQSRSLPTRQPEGVTLAMLTAPVEGLQQELQLLHFFPREGLELLSFPLQSATWRQMERLWF